MGQAQNIEKQIQLIVNTPHRIHGSGHFLPDTGGSSVHISEDTGSI